MEWRQGSVHVEEVVYLKEKSQPLGGNETRRVSGGQTVRGFEKTRGARTLLGRSWNTVNTRGGIKWTSLLIPTELTF